MDGSLFTANGADDKHLSPIGEEKDAPLSWLSIIKLGLVQTALGAIVVLTTSTLNRVMVVELALAASIPGALVALHYAVQMSRPRWGYGADMGGNRTVWIIGGMGVLGLGGSLAAVATAWMGTSFVFGVGLATFAFVLIGLGVGASGTSLLALLASRTAPERRAAAASILWIMMIAGMVVTAIVAGSFLDPFSNARLITVVTSVSVIAFFVTCFAVYGVERGQRASEDVESQEKPSFLEVLQEVWSDGQARLFTVFIFVSMLAYSTQDLILEPLGGHLFGMTPGETTKLAGTQHGGVLLGMVAVAFFASVIGGRILGNLRLWVVGGCLMSGLALAALAVSAFNPDMWSLEATVFSLGLANGAFAVAAIGTMMALAGANGGGREGTRMGIWGAAQAIAFGLGGFFGTVLIDLARAFFGELAPAYATVFAIEAVLFIVAALIATRITYTFKTHRAGFNLTAPVQSS